ncbi:hypothetical protein SOVF_055970 [Spinacia oleracea]|nr:hypothetical protein SOVF_055970 [Spinacia oleracea]
MAMNMKVGYVLLMVVVVVLGTMTQPILAARGTPLRVLTTNMMFEIDQLSNIMVENRPQRCQQRNEICNSYLQCCPDLVCYTRGTCGDLVV